MLVQNVGQEKFGTTACKSQKGLVEGDAGE